MNAASSLESDDSSVSGYWEVDWRLAGGAVGGGGVGGGGGGEGAGKRSVEVARQLEASASPWPPLPRPLWPPLQPPPRPPRPPRPPELRRGPIVGFIFDRNLLGFGFIFDAYTVDHG